MPLYFRKSKRLGPVRVNVSKTGASLTWFPLWPLTRRWSFNSRQRRHRVDLPGPLYWSGRRRPTRHRARMHWMDRLVLLLIVTGLVAGLGWWALHWALVTLIGG